MLGQQGQKISTGAFKARDQYFSYLPSKARHNFARVGKGPSANEFGSATLQNGLQPLQHELKPCVCAAPHHNVRLQQGACEIVGDEQKAI
eukprot:1159873-Pelagomonas_calceolata.AAC.1